MKSFSISGVILLSCIHGIESSRFENVTQSDFIVIASMQRSGTTTLTGVIGGHPCAVSGNEIWTDKPPQDILGGHRYTTKNDFEVREKPSEFLSEIHEPLCRDARERGYIAPSCSSCTIVVKMFDIHGMPVVGIQNLMGSDSVDFVVVERDIQEQFCSLQLASQKGDWGTTPIQHVAKEGFNCPTVTDHFAFRHNSWFRLLRTELLNKGRYFLNVPFSSIASCDLKRVASSIFAFGGLQTPVDIDYRDYNLDSLFESC